MTHYVIQQFNKDNYRRFIAKLMGDMGGITPILNNAIKFENEKEAISFKTINSLHGFEVALSDGTDDYQTEVHKYWENRK